MRAFILLAFLVCCSSHAFAAMDKDSCVTKIKAAYTARTGQAMTDGAFNVVVDICKGIIDEIVANAKVQTGIPVSNITFLTTAQGTIQ